MARVVLLQVVILFPLNFYAQKVDAKHYAWYDGMIGETATSLINGAEFIEKIKGSNGKHKYFHSSEFKPGSIIYNKQPYYNIYLKYDVYNDKVLVNFGNKHGIPLLEPNKQLIEGFSIGTTEFLNLSNYNLESLKNFGYCEVLHSAPLFTLFKKHRKVLKTKINRLNSYYEFNDRSHWVLLYEGSYHLIDNKRDLKGIFPEHKEKMKKHSGFLKDRKLDKDKVLLDLLKNIL